MLTKSMNMPNFIETKKRKETLFAFSS